MAIEPVCGMLQHVLLHKLSDGAKSGYQLCSEIERETGRRPSYGSIYPLLERMTAAGDLSVTQDGRRKLYALTTKGKATAKTVQHQRSDLVDTEMSRIKNLAALLEMDPQPVLAVLERAKKGDPPLGPITANMFALRDQAFRMVQDGRAQKHAARINKILAHARKQMEAIR